MKRHSLRQSVHAQLIHARKKENERSYRALPRAASIAHRILRTRWYIALTIVLTIYALTAEDIRLYSTDKPADIYFDCVTAFTLLFFVCDMIINSIGQEDYLFGNMFLLDIVSTATMLLDFSFLDITGIDKRNLDNFRSARTARLGVRASRISQTMKQWRCYKVIKVKFFVEDSFTKELAQIERKVGPGDDVGEESPNTDIDTKYESMIKESTVGRKLSELTVCRVICVVLAMVVFIPILQLGSETKMPVSASYGSELVHGAFKKLQTSDSESNRVMYENAMLRQVYTHNWFSRASGCTDEDRACPADYYSSVFWFGFVGSGSADETLLDLAQLRNDTIEAFEKKVSNTIFDYGTVPSVVRTALASRWSTRCDDSHMGVSLLGQTVDNVVVNTLRCPEDLRSREWTMYAPRLRPKAGQSKDLRIVFYTDDRPYVHQSSILNLMCTSFICLVLCISSMVISDANNVVLRPLESMMLKVQLIKINPLMAKELAYDALKSEEIQRERQETRLTRHSKVFSLYSPDMASLQKRRTRMPSLRLPVTGWPFKKGTKKKPNKVMETRVLENTIIKLGMLLMLGFGEAGVNIIGRNMDSGGDGKEARAWVNGMARGVKVDCLIGVTRIGDFELITEVLQCGIMSFVNKVCEIVHGVAEMFSGCPNQTNNGSFLIMWSSKGMDAKAKTKLADMATVTFARIFAAVHSSRVLSSYQKHPGLQQKLLSHCRVNLTSGLHYGWAIEGAVGTEFKLDANYMSQNVSLAESVETACEVYGVHFLLTGSVLKNLTPEMANIPRLIDRVTFDKNISPKSIIVDLYVLDMNCSPVRLEPPLGAAHTSSASNSRTRFKFRQQLECQKNRKWSSQVQIIQYMTKGWGMEAIQRLFTEEFLQVFKMGLHNYFEGEWGSARTWLTRCRNMLGFEDGPSAALLDLMDSIQPQQDVDAPASWKGFHIFDGMKKRSLTYKSIQRSRAGDIVTQSQVAKRLVSIAKTASKNRRKIGLQSNSSKFLEVPPREPSQSSTSLNVRGFEESSGLVSTNTTNTSYTARSTDDESRSPSARLPQRKTWVKKKTIIPKKKADNRDSDAPSRAASTIGRVGAAFSSFDDDDLYTMGGTSSLPTEYTIKPLSSSSASSSPQRDVRGGREVSFATREPISLGAMPADLPADLLSSSPSAEAPRPKVKLKKPGADAPVKRPKKTAAELTAVSEEERPRRKITSPSPKSSMESERPPRPVTRLGSMEPSISSVESSPPRPSGFSMTSAVGRRQISSDESPGKEPNSPCTTASSPGVGVTAVGAASRRTQPQRWDRRSKAPPTSKQ